MRAPRSLQARLAVAISLCVTLLWIAAALATGTILRKEMDKVFDSTLQETAERILPLAVLDVLDRESDETSQRVEPLREHDEYFTYLVRDEEGRVLIRSHAADEGDFPPYQGTGFRQTRTHRLYYDAALRETVTIAVAEPLGHRRDVAREMQLGLALPLLVVIPLSLAAIFVAVRLSLRPVRRLSDDLAARGVQDLSPVADQGLPPEIAPIAGAVNQLLERLDAAFRAERSFTAYAAHELRTPVSGAMAQAQRIQVETTDPEAARRAAEIESTLKRLTRLAEKLMQLARAEGGRLRTGRQDDLRPVLELVASEFDRAGPRPRLAVALPSEPVLSDIDPDAFAILARNLIENGLKHGDQASPVQVGLTADGMLSVVSEGPAVDPETLARLTSRFERGTALADGSGLGLAIVATIAERAGGTLTLHSPAPGKMTGFEAVVKLPRHRPVS